MINGIVEDVVSCLMLADALSIFKSRIGIYLENVLLFAEAIRLLDCIILKREVVVLRDFLLA